MVQHEHLIQRLIFEITARDPAEAQGLQAEISRVYRDRIVPIIERCCAEISEAGRIIRIDSLDLDIGHIDPRRFEEELDVKLPPALRKALSEKIREQEVDAPPGPGPGIASRLELLAFFARYGSLPWWADSARPGLLEETLLQLVSASPEYLRRLMLDLSGDAGSLRRMVRHYDAEALSALVRVLAPPIASTIPGLPLEIEPWLVEIEPWLVEIEPWRGNGRGIPGVRGGRALEVLWQSILGVAGAHPGRVFTVAGFYQEALTRAAAELGMSYPSLVRELARSLRETSVTPSNQLSQLLQTLDPPPAASTGRVPEEPPGDPLPETRPGSRADPWRELRFWVARLPSPHQQRVGAALRDLEKEPAGAPISPDSLARMVQTWRLLLTDTGLLPEVTGGLLAALGRRGAAAGISPTVLAGVTLPLQEALAAPLRETPGPETPPDRETDPSGATNIEDGGGSREARLETLVTGMAVAGDFPGLNAGGAGRIYVRNAGLVLLWPFIERFFQRLGLVREGRFTEVAGIHRGTGLLQYIVSGNAPSLEYLLPLNKVLCGLGVTEVFDFGPPVTVAEAEECESLLIAAIRHAPVLRDMSARSFRAGFLLREGVLSTRDGAWLLQVERKGYDVVIDLFPWSLQWLKLPWMDSPLRVEW